MADVFVAAQAGQGGAQLVAIALQFAAALVGASGGGKVSGIGSGQRGSQFLLCRSIFSVHIECGSAGGDPRSQDTWNLDLGGAGCGDRPALPGRQRHPLVADDQLDVSGGGQFDRRGVRRQLIAGAVNRGRGTLDLMQ